MKESSVKRSEWFANIAFIMVVLILGSLLIRKYYLTPSVNSPTNKTSSKSIAVGTIIAIPEIDWSASRQTLLLAIQSDCPYCELSVPFYQKLSKELKAQDVSLVILVPDSTPDGNAYAEGLGLSFDSLQRVQFDGIGIKKTPTLVLVDGRGEVQRVWAGRLSPNREVEMLGYLKGDPAAISDRDIPETSEINIPVIKPDALLALMAKTRSMVLLDVRTREQYDDSHIADAKNIPKDELAMRAPTELDKVSPIVTYCGCEGINQTAAVALTRLGFNRVFVLEGTKQDWEKAGLTLVSRN